MHCLRYIAAIFLTSALAMPAFADPPDAPAMPDVLSVIHQWGVAQERLGPQTIDIVATLKPAKGRVVESVYHILRNDPRHFVTEVVEGDVQATVYVNSRYKLIFFPTYNAFAMNPPEGYSEDQLFRLGTMMDLLTRGESANARTGKNVPTLRADTLDGEPVYIVIAKSDPKKVPHDKKPHVTGLNVVIGQDDHLVKRLRVIFNDNHNLLVKVHYTPAQGPFPAQTFAFTPPAGARLFTPPASAGW